MKITYTEEAVADILEAITYLNERNPTAAATWTPRSRDASNAWPTGNSTDRSRAFDLVLRCEVGAFRRSASTTNATVTSC